MTRRMLITGGAGFIGCHAAHHFRAAGWEVHVLDNLSRRGTDLNLAWLRSHGPLPFIRADLRDAPAITAAVQDVQPNVILHLAGQVAVTTSVTNPREDFETNALGTFNVLEACRSTGQAPLLLYSSTNKVYGGMEAVGVVERADRYAYRDLPSGVPETMPLDFHSPYGCSKGAADQYVRDYARIYGIPGVVLRQSCIYGPRQFGVEDQGWIAWFAIAATLGRPITVYGDGKQIRDVLHIDDLIRCYEACIAHPDRAAGEVFNIGGGPAQTLSLLELLDQLRQLTSTAIQPAMADWRPGDQRVFVSDVSKAARVLGWAPRITPAEGVRTLYDWVQRHAEEIRALGV